MRLTPTRPVTINSVRHGERWFPFLFRHTDGSLLLYIGHGHDRHFAPHHRLRSVDGGRTWIEGQENVPRCTWCHSFADGELFEMDSYGFAKPGAKDSYYHYAAWSRPADASRAPTLEPARVHTPSSVPVTLASMMHAAYPTYPWWPLYNALHGKEELSGKEILVGGPIMTAGVEVEGRLLAVGYLPDASKGDWSVSSSYLFESRDRGYNWEEVSVVARGMKSDATPEGYNEAAFTQLRDGRLYSIVRSGGTPHHTWSSDGGKSWSVPEPVRLHDGKPIPKGGAWPAITKLTDGTLAFVYGRPGKHLLLDPSGTGRGWNAYLDLHAWELSTQEIMGVPPEQRLHGPTHLGVRYWDSSDYMSVIPTGDRELTIVYDVQSYVENWNAYPVSGVRMLRVRVEE